MPSGRASKLDVTQDQGAKPLLCFHCEQQISKDIEKPAIELYKRQLGSRSWQVDPILFTRYAASIWGRAMLSEHKFYKHIEYNPQILIALLQAIVTPQRTSKNFSIRLRHFTDSSGIISGNTRKLLIATMANHLPTGTLPSNHHSFCLISEGLVWEIFYPRLSRPTASKLGCLSFHKKRVLLASYDFVKDATLLNHCANQLAKHRENTSTHAFRKAIPPLHEI